MSTPRSLVPLAAMSLALSFLLGSAAPLGAQEEHPGERGRRAFPITPDPADCQVEPRATDELLALWYTPEGSPVPAATPMTGATSVSVPLGSSCGRGHDRRRDRGRVRGL